MASPSEAHQLQDYLEGNSAQPSPPDSTAQMLRNNRERLQRLTDENYHSYMTSGNAFYQSSARASLQSISSSGTRMFTYEDTDNAITNNETQHTSMSSNNALYQHDATPTRPSFQSSHVNEDTTTNEETSENRITNDEASENAITTEEDNENAITEEDDESTDLTSPTPTTGRKRLLFSNQVKKLPSLAALPCKTPDKTQNLRRARSFFQEKTPTKPHPNLKERLLSMSRVANRKTDSSDAERPKITITRLGQSEEGGNNEVSEYERRKEMVMRDRDRERRRVEAYKALMPEDQAKIRNVRKLLREKKAEFEGNGDPAWIRAEAAKKTANKAVLMEEHIHRKYSVDAMFKSKHEPRRIWEIEYHIPAYEDASPATMLFTKKRLRDEHLAKRKLEMSQELMVASRDEDNVSPTLTLSRIQDIHPLLRAPSRVGTPESGSVYSQE